MRLLPYMIAVLFLSPTLAGFSIATFQADVTPPLGSPLCGGGVPPVQSVTDPLSARGIVFFPKGEKPLVLCAVDWVGIGNDGHRAWREALAIAANTDANRVTVHALHQHDAPFCDFNVEGLLEAQGIGGATFDVVFAREAIANTATALAESIESKSPVTHLAAGEGIVKNVASNRRILGENKKVRVTRWTATGDPAVRAEPVGTIDPFCKSVSFWNGETPLAVLTYYATHPQSHYGKGHVTTDFVGMARSAREKALPGVPHIHFNGAGGNLGAGKWNDGAPENRPVLAKRLEDGMARAWDAAKKTSVDGMSLQWDVVRRTLPSRHEMNRNHEETLLSSGDAKKGERVRSAYALAWLNRSDHGAPIELSRLRVGNVQFLHLPGELFVEYQLAAQDMDASSMVCVAAYGDYGPGYIGTKVAYAEGGYETAVYVAHCGPAVEEILLEGMRALVE
jgi:hypothetical protein